MNPRYVQQLIKLNDTFSRVLLPPSATSPSLNMVDATHTLPRTLSPASLNSRTESFDHLPIAAHYASNTSPSDDRPSPAVVPGPRMEAYHTLTNGRPSHKNGCNTLNRGRSHQSLPPPSSSANHSGGGGFSAFTRMSYQPRVGSTSSSIRSVPQDVHLPEDLETVVAVLAGGILEGHIKLAAALRRRYDDQYPLVRSLADVFTAHVGIEWP